MRFCTLCTIFAAHAAWAQPWPLNEVSQGGTARPISILQIRIQELKFGHEGPDYFPVDRAPFRGGSSEEFVGRFRLGQLAK
jgi:hypothetical protein